MKKNCFNLGDKTFSSQKTVFDDNHIVQGYTSRFSNGRANFKQPWFVMNEHMFVALSAAVVLNTCCFGSIGVLICRQTVVNEHMFVALNAAVVLSTCCLTLFEF